MATAVRTLRRRAAVAAVSAALLAANALLPGAAIHRLPYVIGLVTVVFLTQTFWEDRVAAGGWLGLGTGVLILALAASINISVNRTDGDRAVAAAETTTTTVAASQSSTTLVAGTDVPAEVAGTSETRDDAHRLVACESALEQIAAAIRAAGGTVDVPVTPEGTPGTEPDTSETQRRLTSCDVRLRAIAETLPR